MNEPNQPPTPDHLSELLREGTHEVTVACIERLGAADTDTRKRALRALRDVAAERPRSVEDLIDPLSTFLTDEDRAVRLTTAKLFVTLAQSEPSIVLPAVDVLADRLADEDEWESTPSTTWKRSIKKSYSQLLKIRREQSGDRLV